MLEREVDPRDALEGLVHHHQPDAEGDERAERHRPRPDLLPGVGEKDEKDEDRRGLDERRGEGHHPRPLPEEAERPLVHLAEAIGLVPFRAVGLDDPVSAERLRQDARQVAHPFAPRLRDPPEPVRDQHDRDDDRRGDDEGEERQLRGARDDEDREAGDRRDGLHEVRELGPEQALDPVHVPRDARDEVAGRVPCVEGSRLPEEAFVEQPADVPHEGEPDRVETVLRREGAQVLQEERHEEEEGQGDAPVLRRHSGRALEAQQPVVEPADDGRLPRSLGRGERLPEAACRGIGRELLLHRRALAGREDLVEERSEEVGDERGEERDADHREDRDQRRPRVRAEETREACEVLHARPFPTRARTASAVRPGAPGGPRSSRPRARRRRASAALAPGPRGIAPPRQRSAPGSRLAGSARGPSASRRRDPTGCSPSPRSAPSREACREGS